jgi:hypothetical protein
MTATEGILIDCEYEDAQEEIIIKEMKSYNVTGGYVEVLSKLPLELAYIFYKEIPLLIKNCK